MVVPGYLRPHLAEWETTGDVGHVSHRRASRFGSIGGYKEGKGGASLLLLPLPQICFSFLSAFAAIAHTSGGQSPLPFPLLPVQKDGQGEASQSRTCPQSEAQVTATEERKKKKKAAGGGEKRDVGETIRKRFSSATHSHHLEALVAEKSLASTVKYRLSGKEALPTLANNEQVLHQEFFGRGLGFPLHSFMRGLLHFYGCQLHHVTPNAILHQANFVTVCECYLGITPHLELLGCFFWTRVQKNMRDLCDLEGANLQLLPKTKFFKPPW